MFPFVSPIFRRNVKTTKKKIAFTAFLTTLITLGIFIPIFWFNNNNASPLGKWIYAQFTCLQTGKPIVGLSVTCKGYYTADTNATGWVVFGSGFGSGTYTLEWMWWDGPHSEEVTIDCTKKDWFVYYTVINPEVHKTFRVDTVGYPPIEGLEVSLTGYENRFTDADGYVEWVVDYFVKDYVLNWTWNGKPGEELVHFEDGQGVWEGINDLEPKSVEANLNLPEESGR